MSHDPQRDVQRGTALPVEPELQRLLAQANLEYGAPRDEVAAFRRLTLAMERSGPERGLRPWLWVCAGVGAAALALVVLRGQLLQGSMATLQLAPEPPVTSVQREAQREAAHEVTREVARTDTGDTGHTAESEPPVVQAPQSALSLDGPARERPARAPLMRQDDAVRPPRRTSVAPSSTPRSAPPAAPAVALPVTAPRSVDSKLSPDGLDEDCLALARDGQPRPAERCFVRRSQGAGLSAEMALYELARLRRDVLGDTQGALGALGDYRQRFPAGSLRNEVDVSRIELLARLERRQEALSASEQLLATPAGRERAAELRLLRGKVLRASGSLREAVAEYASAERLGGALADEATFLRAQCLEALGDVAAARQAYERAAQSTGPRRSEARERLAALPRSTP
ncbi:MAG: hypothetical protein RL685_2982 [Pseudomonadota bacterium]|jgi:predicted negative regulator of RcsB-dependent stress response